MRRTLSRAQRNPLAVAAAGPAVIVAATLVPSLPFLVGHRFPAQYDLLAEWMPNFCFLGHSLRAGHLPLWNPHVMGGVPFAADPQSGWLNLPAMLLFGTLGCATALRLYLLVQPLLGGLGIYEFLRAERLSRPVATTGGLIASLMLAGSRYFALPWLSASMGWTALTLAAVARLLNAGTWRARLLWTAAAALAWGQEAAAHLSDGLVVGTAMVAFYVAGRALADIRADRRSGRQAAALLGVLVVALPVVNLGYFLPRLGYLPQTTLAKGYGWLERESKSLTGFGGFTLPSPIDARWPFAVSLGPGLFLGATGSILLLASWWSRRYRDVVASAAAFALACYVLTVPAVATFLGPRLPTHTLRDFYMHSPFGLADAWPLILAVLAAVGLQAWSEPHTSRARRTLVAVALAVFGVLPVAFGGGLHILPFVVGAIAGVAALVAVSRGRAPTALVTAVIAVELVVNAAAGWLFAAPTGKLSPPAPLLSLASRNFDIASYVRAGPIVRALRAAGGTRYVSIDPGRLQRFGYIFLQRRDQLPLLGSQQSMVFGFEEAQGYNSVQLVRYWRFVRAADPERLAYSATYFVRPPPVALDLLDIGAIVAPAGRRLPGAGVVARDGAWQLWRLARRPPRASVVPSWTVADGSDAAMRQVLAPGFDVERQVVLERQPAAPAAAGAGTASYRPLGTDSARVDVTTSHAAIVLIRNSYDPHWHVTIDGRPARLLAADYVDQGVAVPAGRHTLRLTYRDGAVGNGLIGSAIALALLLGAAALAGRRRLRARPVFRLGDRVGNTNGGVPHASSRRRSERSERAD